jgi:hypothetical protein
VGSDLGVEWADRRAGSFAQGTKPTVVRRSGAVEVGDLQRLQKMLQGLAVA